MNAEIIEKLAAICGPSNIRSDEDHLIQYGKDWTFQPGAKAGLVVFPRSTEEVSKILKTCNELKVSVIPSGGRTGLAGGAVALNAEIVLSFDRMNKILSVDPVDMSATVEAGVTTQALQEAAKEKGVFFALDLAAKGSCQIGGNISTNAGGLKLIKYGGMREQILGIEAVLADGTIIDANRALRKNNTGFDLRQLFIGTEGTLGVVTKATVKLCPLPKDLEIAMLAIKDFKFIPQLLGICSSMGEVPTAFEFFDHACYQRVRGQHPTLQKPFEADYPFYVLLELEKRGTDSTLEKMLEKAFEAGLVEDGVLASSSKQFSELWSFRENISESLSSYKYLYKNDIAVSIGSLNQCVSEIAAASNGFSDNLKLYLFGHIGDGNIHLNYGSDTYDSHADFVKDKNLVEAKIFAIIKKLRGTISAEHGIGILKKSQIDIVLSQQEIALLQKIKTQLDPHGILNPGKILPS